MVAILTNKPISDAKNTKIKQVPSVKIKIQLWCFFKIDRLNSLDVCAITLGEASSVVSVVLIMVVRAAIAIIANQPLPISDVYSPISWPANIAPLEEKETALPYITVAPSKIKHNPKTNVTK